MATGASLALVVLSTAGWAPRATLAAATGADWVSAASLRTTRQAGAAAVLDGPPCRVQAAPAWCGKVLVTGGFQGQSPAHLSSAELYDPVGGAWSATGAMAIGRVAPLLVGLNSGLVLAVGGASGRLAELYDPATATWSATGPMQVSRSGSPVRMTATRLADGRVLAAGGFSGSTTTKVTEIYDPATNAWTRTGDLNIDRRDHTAVLLADGRVLVVGGEHSLPQDDPPGQEPAATSAEIYDPATGSWALTEPPPVARNRWSSVLLDDGRVLLLGGLYSTDLPAESRGTPYVLMFYNPGTGKWATTETVQRRGANFYWITKLPDGRVFVIPNSSAAASSAVAEIFDPTASRTTTYDLPKAWDSAAFAILPCRASGGRLLAAGGALPDDGPTVASAQVFTGIPTIQQVSPAAVPMVGGAEVTIKGIGLAPRGSGGVTVNFGTLSVAGTASADGTQITAKAPAASSEGPVDIGVTVGGVKAERCLSGPFVYAAGPKIDTVAPETGPATGGQRVTVAGSGLGGTVTLDGQPVPGATVSATGISFDTPPHDPGPVTVGVDNGVGQSTRTYTYLPAVKSLSPASGPPAGGTPVTITGKGLASATEVQIGGKVAELVSKTDGEVQVKTPAHDPGKVLVSIRTDKGIAVPASAGADAFEYVTPAVPGGGVSGPDPARAAPGAEGGGSGGSGSSQPPLGGGGTGGGGTGGGGLTTNVPASTTITPNPVGSGGLTTGAPSAAATASPTSASSGLVSPAPTPSAVANPSASPIAGPSGAPVAPPAPASASPVGQGAPGPTGAGLPGGGGDNTQGAPRYAMVGRRQDSPAPALAFAGGAMLLVLFGSAVVAVRPASAGRTRPGLGTPRPQGAY